jgi:[protein-PII] uridylyltransferase
LEAHARLEAGAGAAGVAVQLEATLSAFRLTVIAPDRNGLFASFAGALASFGMNILKAEAYANREGVILDTFVFADPNHMLGNNPAEADRLTDLFRRVALGRTDARKLMRPALTPATARRAQPEIRFEDVPSSPTTMVEIHAADRPGLLYSLASAFSGAGCDIQVVLIDTQGGRAQDVFYVAHQNRPLSAEMQAQLAGALRAAC